MDPDNHIKQKHAQAESLRRVGVEISAVLHLQVRLAGSEESLIREKAEQGSLSGCRRCRGGSNRWAPDRSAERQDLSRQGRTAGLRLHNYRHCSASNRQAAAAQYCLSFNRLSGRGQSATTRDFWPRDPARGRHPREASKLRHI